MIKVNGVTLPSPQTYKVKLSDLDSEGTARNAAGMLLRDRVRAGVYRIDASWVVRKSDYMTIVSALSAVKFTVTFFDPNSATDKTAQMYVGDRDGNLIKNATNPLDSVWELSCSLIEY